MQMQMRTPPIGLVSAKITDAVRKEENAKGSGHALAISKLIFPRLELAARSYAARLP